MACVKFSFVGGNKAIYLSLTNPSDEGHIQKHNVLCWAEGFGNAVQDEQTSSSMQTEM